MTRISKYKQDFVLFLELGFVAVNQSDEDSALKLFDAAQALDPKSTLPVVGKGYLFLQKLELAKAIKLFKTVLENEPENEMAKTFYGICLSMAPEKETEGENILKQTLQSEDPLIKRLSTDSLEFVEKFVKKDATPAQVRKSK